MVERLTRGEGYSPSESGKERQRPIDSTGCPYADNELIPTLRATRGSSIRNDHATSRYRMTRTSASTTKDANEKQWIRSLPHQAG